jgi:hypothetical protein
MPLSEAVGRCQVAFEGPFRAGSLTYTRWAGVRVAGNTDPWNIVMGPYV